MSESPTVHDTEKVLLSFIEAVNAGDLAKAKTFGAKGATWWILGHPDKSSDHPIAGTHPFEETLSRALPKFNQILDAEPFTVTVKDIIVSSKGDKAALELVPHGRSSKGMVYENMAFMKVKLDGYGKITEIREYLDISKIDSIARTSVL